MTRPSVGPSAAGASARARLGARAVCACALWVALGAVVPAAAGSLDYSEIPCARDLIPEVCAAAAVAGEADRPEALYRELEKALRSADAAVRDTAFSYLLAVMDPPAQLFVPGLDPRPLRDALQHFDVIETATARQILEPEKQELNRLRKTRGQRLLDEADLRRAPRETRIALCRIAIRDGEAHFGALSSLSRNNAILMAADDGLDDLAQTVAARCESLSDLDRFNRSCPYIALALEVRAGARDRTDADARAARRVAAMPAAELFARLRSSAAWRRLLGEVASRTCYHGALVDCQALAPAFRGLQQLTSEYLKAPDHQAAPSPDLAAFREEMNGTLQGLVSIKERERVEEERNRPAATR